MPTVREFSVGYCAVNEGDTFTSGDYIRGRVVLELEKEAKIKHLFIKLKGDADVKWTEYGGKQSVTYHGYERYFKLKETFISDDSGCTVVRPGRHTYPFTFQIPQGNFPSSFKGNDGRVAYILEAKLKQPWKMTKKALISINFTTKLDDYKIFLMLPQAGKEQKKMSMFTSGNVSFKALVEKKGYMPGETLLVRAEIDNSSSRDLKPKFKLERKITYIVGTNTRTEREVIFKEVCSPIPSNHQETVTKELRIPPSISPTILFCSILTVEYTLKVYIDVPYAFDPEIKFPIVIIPADRHGPLLSALALVSLGRRITSQNNPPTQSDAPEAGHKPLPPDAAQCPDESFPAATLPALQPSPFSEPASAYPVPGLPPPMRPDETDQQPPPQYDQVTMTNDRASTPPPLYPGLPAPDFLSSPNAPQYLPGAGPDFLSDPNGTPQQYAATAEPSFLSQS